jgi:hypothetical protein
MTGTQASNEGRWLRFEDEKKTRRTRLCYLSLLYQL